MKKAISFKGRKQFFKKVLFSTALVSILFTIFMVLPAFAEGGNIILNPGFEEVSGNLPTNWKMDAYLNDPGITKVSVEDKGRDESKCLVVENIEKNDVKIVQDVDLQLGKVYKIKFWLKAENFDSKSPAGGNLTILGGIYETRNIIDTKGEWQMIEAYTRVRSTGSDPMKVAMRVGGFGTPVKGKVYFDDVSVELVENLPDGVKPVDFFIPGNSASGNGKAATSNTDKKSGSKKPIIIVAIIVIVVGALVFVEIKYAKRSKNSEDGSGDKKEDIENEDDEYEEDEDE